MKIITEINQDYIQNKKINTFENLLKLCFTKLNNDMFMQRKLFNNMTNKIKYYCYVHITKPNQKV